MCGGGSGGDDGAAAGRLGDARCLAIRPVAPIMLKLMQGVNLMWCCCAAVVTPDKNFWLLRLTHGSRNSFVSPGKLPLRNELSQICGSVVRQASVSGASDHFRSSPYGLHWSRNLETGGLADGVPFASFFAHRRERRREYTHTRGEHTQ